MGEHTCPWAMYHGFKGYDCRASFIGLAASALGGVHPVGTMIASLFFGFADALSNYMQSLNIPSEFVQMIPYLATLLGLGIFARQQMARERRGVRAIRGGIS